MSARRRTPLDRTPIVWVPIPRAAAYDWLASEEHLRDKSELKTLRSVHNRIKSSLILDAVTSSSARADAPLRVLDLACGRGGDLDKWTQAAVSRCAGRGGDNRATLAYVGVDISSKSVETAKKRYSGRKDARFIEGDAAMDAVARQSIDVIGIMVRARARARARPQPNSPSPSLILPSILSPRPLSLSLSLVMLLRQALLHLGQDLLPQPESPVCGHRGEGAQSRRHRRPPHQKRWRLGPVQGRRQGRALCQGQGRGGLRGLVLAGVVRLPGRHGLPRPGLVGGPVRS